MPALPPLRTINEVLEHQRKWAETTGLTLDPTAVSLADRSSALFVDELSSLTLADLTAGAGSELGRIHSLRSSSCLALNVFEPWRSNPRPLATVFGGSVQALSFEEKQRTGLQGVAPHLDVFLAGRPTTVGIESKFLEMYSPTDNHFSDSYFDVDGLWQGLENSRNLALEIASGGQRFHWLHAAQLLKHALGLRRNQSDNFRLVLVWYRLDSGVAEQIESEIGRFAIGVSDDFDFTSMTYQELVWRLNQLDEPMPGYLEYLSHRYRLGGEWQRRLPLLDSGSRPSINRLTSLDSTIEALDIDELSGAYFRSIAEAPQRTLRQKKLIVGHDGASDASTPNREKVVAKALFNQRAPLQIGEHSVTLIDYEVPLRAERADGGIGEIDLLGLDETNRLWIIELKVSPNTETPLKALLQALRYSAILDANRRAIAMEIGERTMKQIRWPAVLAVSADRVYWERLTSTAKAGAWLEAISRLTDRIESTLGLSVWLLDLGDLKAEVIDGRARLVSAPDVATIRS